MKLHHFNLFTALLLFFSTLGVIQLSAKESVQKSMTQELDVLKNSFYLRYAPKEWKRDLFGWQVDKVFSQAQKRIYDEHPTKAKEFQKIIRQVFQSTKDYHVMASFYSTETAYFPLEIKGSHARYFVSSTVYQDPEYAEIQVGDEVTSINGIPIGMEIEKLIDENLAGDRTPTGYALAAQMVFDRRGKYGQTVPSGTYRLSVKHRGDEISTNYFLKWGYTKELIKESIKQKGKGLQLTKVKKPLNEILNRNYSVELAENLKHKSDIQDDNREKSFLPPLGKILWESPQDFNFYAYLFENSFGQHIGYLHIPSFNGNAADIDQIIQILQVFSLESEALVIDITNNPGGKLFYMYALLSLLTDRPMAALPAKEIITQVDVHNAILLAKECKTQQYSDEELTEEFFGYPINTDTRLSIINYAKKIISSWEKGRRMTDLLTMIDEIHPHPTMQYIKPIMVLINELDFSCADIFPAILQDNGRAILFGKKTAGAGGYFIRYTYPSQFGIRDYSLTASLIYRLDGYPIENKGVTPTIPYEVSVKDLTDNYPDYIDAVNEAMHSMTN